MAIEIAKKYFDGYVDHAIGMVEVRWAKLIAPDTAFGKNEWSIDLVLSEEQAKEFGDLGFNVREKDGDKLLRLKKKAVTAAGAINKPPQVVGPDAMPFTEEIGNGSICNINFSAKAWAVGATPTLAGYLNGVQVVQHVGRGSVGFAPVTEEAFS